MDFGVLFVCVEVFGLLLFLWLFLGLDFWLDELDVPEVAEETEGVEVEKVQLVIFSSNISISGDSALGTMTLFLLLERVGFSCEIFGAGVFAGWFFTGVGVDGILMHSIVFTGDSLLVPGVSGIFSLLNFITKFLLLRFGLVTTENAVSSHPGLSVMSICNGSSSAITKKNSH